MERCILEGLSAVTTMTHKTNLNTCAEDPAQAEVHLSLLASPLQSIEMKYLRSFHTLACFCFPPTRQCDIGTEEGGRKNQTIISIKTVDNRARKKIVVRRIIP